MANNPKKKRKKERKKYKQTKIECAGMFGKYIGNSLSVSFLPTGQSGTHMFPAGEYIQSLFPISNKKKEEKKRREAIEEKLWLGLSSSVVSSR